MWYSLLESVTDAIVGGELAQALGSLPAWRLEKALSYRFDTDRYTCAKAYLMLRGLLRKHYGIDQDVEFGFGPCGKPFLKDFPSIHFNLSHCRRAVLCAVGDRPIGADVEEIQYDALLEQQVFSDSERLYIGGSAQRFTELWTRKESYLKLLGTGLCDDLKSVLDSAPAVFSTSADLSAGVVTTVCEKLL